MTDKYIQLKDAGNNNLFPATNYNDSINKPSINGMPLVGNRTLEELGFSNTGKDLIWTNSSPTDVFAAQTVSFDKDITNYDAFIVETHYANTSDGNNTTNIVLNDGIKHNIFGAKDSTLSGSYFNYRGVTFNASSAVFTNAAYIGSATNYNLNYHCIPLKIYGFYFGTKITGNDGRVGTKDLLWTNASPASDFAAQTVTLSRDTSNYDAFIVEAVFATTAGNKHSSIILNDGEKQSFTAPRFSSGGQTIAWRDVTISGNTAVFDTAGYVSTSTSGTGVNFCVPLKIYGVNFGTKNTYNYTYTLNGTSTELVDILYPIGSIYLSVSATNPGTLFGGTWEQIAEGQTLWSAGASYAADTYVEPGLPNITGTGHYADNNGNWTGALYDAGHANYIGDGSASGTLIGLDASRSNPIYGNATTVRPPAFVVYMWKRTA